jgi:acyl-CoA synthetase (AMP-forming)/AMP-acid ligase II
VPDVVPDLIDAAAKRWPQAPAVSDATGTDSYAELRYRARCAAGWLSAHGVRPGDRVVLRLPGGRDFAALLYGVLAAGAVAVPVSRTTGPFHLRWILRDAAPAMVVTVAEDVPAVRQLAPAPVHDPPPRIDGTDGPQTAPRPADTAPRPADTAPRPADTAPRPADVALLLYTSGTTAMPRAVVCPHERVRFAVDAIAGRLGYTAADVVLCRVPVSFDYGLYQLFLAAGAGAHVVFRPDLPEAALLATVRATGATVLPIVPTLATILVTLAGRDFGAAGVRLLTNTGAALGTGLAAGLRSAFPGASVVPMYGLTECKRATIADPDEDLRYPGTVGRALPGTEVVVVDDDGVPVPAGVTGEIRVHGPHIMAGYWRAPDATRDRFGDAGGLLRTGDYGYLDDGGRLYFVGRRDDIFKRMTVRMSAQEVEAAVLDVDGVAAAAALPPGPDGELVVYVVGDVSAREVLAAVARRVDRARVPDRCVVLDALPTTTNGKVDRRALHAAVGAPPV